MRTSATPTRTGRRTTSTTTATATRSSTRSRDSETATTTGDDDGIADRLEAGDAEVSTPPVDSDGDGIADFRDLDSDNDGLTDIEETALGSSAVLADTDGDGVSDFIEVRAATDPGDPADSPTSRLGVTFVLWPGATPQPAEHLIAITLGDDQPDTPTTVHATFEAIDPDAGAYVESLRATPSAAGCSPLTIASVAFPDDAVAGARRGDTVCWTLRPRPSSEADREARHAGYVRIHVEGGVEQRHGVLFSIPECSGPCGPG